MDLPSFPFQTINWNDIAEEKHSGSTGHAIWQVFQLGKTRIRKLQYSPGYLADHWCSKGHIIHCVTGEMVTELEDGRSFYLNSGMTYVVGDHSDAHRSRTESGCVLFVVD